MSEFVISGRPPRKQQIDGRVDVNIAASDVALGGGTQYTEGDTDATITGTAMVFETNTGTNALGVVSATNPLPISDNSSTISVDDGAGSLTVDGTVAATQSGTWNVNNVSGTVSLPTGAATEATLASIKTATELIDDTVATDGAATPAKGILIAGQDGTNAQTIKTDSDGNLQVDVLTMPTTTVQATNLDIRDLTSASDNVEIKTAAGVALNLDASGDVQVDVKTITAGDNMIGRVKLTDGTDVADIFDLANSNPLTVAIVDGSGDQITSFGGGTQYTEADTDASITGTAVMWEDAADTLRAVSATKPLPVDIKNTTIAVTQSGTWDEVGINDSGNSITVDNPTLSVVGGGTEATALRVTVASDSTGVLSVDDNGSTLSIDDGAGSITVDNGGTFAVQATVAAGATNIAKAEDVASADADVGVPAMAVRKATPANTSGTDGDYEMLQMSAGRLWTSATIDAAIPAGTNNIGDVDVLSIAAGDNNIGNVDIVTVPAPLSTTGGGTEAAALRVTIANDSTGVVSVDDNGSTLSIDDGAGSITVDGTVAATQSGTWVLGANSGVDIGDVDVTSIVPGTGATNLGKAEDAAHTTGDVGVATLTVRTDSPATTGARAGTDGDYANFASDSKGGLHTSGGIALEVTGTGANQNDTPIAATDVSNFKWIYLAITGTFGLTYTFEGSNDNSTWFTATLQKDGASPAIAYQGTTTGLFQGPVPARYFRVRVSSAINTGTVTARAEFSWRSGVLTVSPAGSTQYAEDTAHSSGDLGNVALTVRKDTATALADADGDYATQETNARGALWVAIEDGAGGQITSFGGGTQYTEDAAAAANPVGTAMILVREDARAGGLTTTDGDNVAARGNNKGELYVKATDTDALLTTIDADTGTIAGAVSGTEMQVDIVGALPAGTNAIGKLAANSGVDIGDVDVTSIVPGTGATNLGKAEDAAHTTGDTGVMVLTVRKDTAAALAGTDGDYAPPETNARGATWVAIEDGAGGQITSFGGGTQYTEDVASAADPVGTMLIARRRDSPASEVSADGDNIALNASAKGALYIAPIAGSMPIDDNSGSITVDGTLTVNDAPTTSGGYTKYHLISAGSTNATNIKASAGQVYGWSIYNSATTARKVAFHDTSGTPTAGASIYFTVHFPPLSVSNIALPAGTPFSSGIAITTVTGMADTDATAVTANDLGINIFYK